MSTRRKFTDTFSLGDMVNIIRTEHGWFDGSIGGPIVEISDYTCVVKVEDPLYEGLYSIEKPRDIHLDQSR